MNQKISIVSKKNVVIGKNWPEKITKSNFSHVLITATVSTITLICRCLDVKAELDDFTEGSRQLEAELEMSLQQHEKTIRDLKLALNQLQIDNESLRVQ